MEKERVLMIMPAINVCGGMESFVMSYFEHIDTSQMVFDFVVHDIGKLSYKDEIERLGGKVYLMPRFSLKSISTIREKFKEILKSNDYHIVHCNMANAAFVYLNVAKEMGVPVRILHSHQNKAADTFSHAVRNVPLIAYGKRYANVRFACSDLAGRYLFGNKKYVVITNGIDYTKFKYNNELREKYRKDMGIEDKYVIGNTGRLCPQKNQEFLLDVFASVHKKNNKSVLLLVGEGNDKEMLENKIRELGLEDYVIMTGARSDIDGLLQAMDVFVFPSVYEGLGISLLEAQAASLKCICSTGVPDEAKISDKLTFLSLKDDKDIWVDEILKDGNYERKNVVLDDKFNIEHCGKKLQNMYMKYIKELSK